MILIRTTPVSVALDQLLPVKEEEKAKDASLVEGERKAEAGSDFVRRETEALRSAQSVYGSIYKSPE